MSENKYLRTIVKALDDKKGNDIRVIRISEISSMCDYLVIADVQQCGACDAGSRSRNEKSGRICKWRMDFTGLL